MVCPMPAGDTFKNGTSLPLKMLSIFVAPVCDTTSVVPRHMQIGGMGAAKVVSIFGYNSEP